MELEVVESVAHRAVQVFLDAAPRTVVLAGGSTPRTTYEELAKVSRSWDGVEIFFGDERCVPAEDPDSNYRMAFDALLRHVPEAMVHPMTGCDPEAYAAMLAEVCGSREALPRLDFIFLGLGPDGHTASLFPQDPVLELSDRWVALVDRPDHQRMTLTVPVLCEAKQVVFLVSGAAKRDALRQLLDGGDIPAARVQAERILVLADHEAVG